MNRQPNVQIARARPLWARATVLLLCQLVAWQPLAASAGNIVQQPMFTVSSVRANVMLMIDDSSSMQGYRLPVPAGLTAPTGNVSVRYNAGMRTVSGADEFALRAPAINPLWYNPTVHYAPWNDNNKTLVGATSFPAVAINFPNADIGGNANVADLNVLTQRDMRYRTPGQRDWVTQARGTVGEGNSWRQNIDPASQWSWNSTASPARWEKTLANPAGIAIYPPIPAEGSQGEDLFTNPGTPTCTASPPCVAYTPTYTNQCVASVPVFQNQCVTYQQVQNGFDNVCSQYQQVLTGYQNGACTQYQQVQTGTVCGQWDVVPVPDATSETGFRDTLVCGRYDPVYAQQCVTYAQVPVYQNQCVAYTPVPHYDNVCTQYQQVQTGTQCTQYQQVQTGQTCNAYQNPWTCPPQNVVITADTLTPARYYRYEGPQPGTPADRSTASNYRMIEIDRALGWNGTTQDPAINRYDVIDPVSGLPSTRSSCAAGSWCTWAEEAQNFANWYTYYRNRLFAAMAVGSQATADLTGPEQYLRIGYGRINYFPQGPQPWDVTNLGNRLPATLPALDGTANPPGAIERGVREFSTGTPERQALFNWLFSLNWVGSTPNREAVDAVGRYYSRSDSAGPWGDFPGTNNGRAPIDHLWCRRNYTLLATDGEWTRVNPGTNPPPQPLIQNVAVLDPLGQGGSVLDADGANGPAITGQDKITLSALSYQYNPAAITEQSYGLGSSGQTATLSDVMMYYWSRDLRAGTDALRNRLDRIPATATKAGNPAFWQHMSTFVIGYGVNASMDTAANRAAIATAQAVTWPDVGIEDCRITDTDATCTANVPGNRINDTMRGALMSRGDFYAAASPQQLRQGILAALQQIVAENSSGSGLGVASTSAATGNLVVQASFTTDLWEGSVRAVDSLQLVNFLRGGPQPVDVWQANFEVPASRNILTSTAATTASTFTWGGISPAQRALLDPNPTIAQDTLDYLRGDTTKEQRNGGSFRNRRNTILGDIVNSSPLYSAKANWANHLAPHATRYASPPALPSSTYRAYVTSKEYDPANNGGRVPIVVLGANDGMLHAFDARQTIHATDTALGFAPGKEIFAYVPRGVYANLPALTNPAYVHKYFVDGQVVEGDVHFGGNEAWRTVVVGSAGAGGRNLFALDVTDPRVVDTSKVLWDITDAEESDLGHVLGAGVIGSVKDQNAPNTKGKWVYMTGNGYESTGNRAVLLMFNMQDGTVEKLDTLAGSALTPNGLGPVAPVYDGNRNIVAAYAGDKLGNLWRFDVSDPNHANWTIRKVFVASDALNNPQPITTAPKVVLHPLGGLYVIFGTGKFFEAGDPLDINVQSVYGLWDKGGTGTIPKTGPGGLAQLVLSDAGSGFRAINSSALDWSTGPGGWYYDMAVGGNFNGERVVAAPILIGGVLQVTSFAPTTQGDPCVPGGLSYIYRLDLAGTFGQSVFLNQLPNVVGVIQQPGSVAGSSVFYLGANAGVTVASETAANQAQNLGNTGVAAVGDQAAEAGSCGEVVAFSGVSGGLGGIEAKCQQYLPLRTWRPLR